MQAVVTRYEVTTEYPMRDSIRIALISDLHERRAEDILALLRAEKPDMIAVTGDTLERYDNRPQYEFERSMLKRALIIVMHRVNAFLRLFERDRNKAKTENAYRFLREAVRIAPVYLSLGNHEQELTESDLRFYRGQGIVLLDNASVRAKVKGFEMLIGGMSSWDYEEFLSDYVGKKGFKLLLCHHPERFEPFIRDAGVDLTLSGHTHGGQIRIGMKGRGLYVPGQGFFGRLARGQFFSGRLIISAGCSNTAAIPRFFNPRELVIVTLKSSDK